MSGTFGLTVSNCFIDEQNLLSEWVESQCKLVDGVLMICQELSYKIEQYLDLHLVQMKGMFRYQTLIGLGFLQAQSWRNSVMVFSTTLFQNL